MNTEQRLAGIFRDVFDDQTLEISDEMGPGNFDLWDSVETVNLMMAVEREFGVRFTTDEVASIKSVGSLKTLIKKHLDK